MGNQERITRKGATRRGTKYLTPHGLHAAQTEIASFGANEFRGLYQAQLEVFDRVNTSPFYLYSTLDLDTAAIESIPFLGPDTVSTFYGRASTHSNRMRESMQNLYSAGWELENDNEMDIDDLVGMGRTILTEGYSLVHNFNVINDTPANLPKGVTVLNPRQQMELRTVCGEIGLEKPESFRETMRRYIPRWMWHPLSYPSEQVPPEREAQMRELWSGYTSKDAHLLIHPDRLAEGKAPLHMAFKAAEVMESEGEDDLGYAIKTGAILEIFAMEKERAEQEETSELPFFISMFAGAMSGEMGLPPKNAHFDYTEAISETMQQTFARLQHEMDEGKDGVATNFLRGVAEAYGEEGFSFLMAMSLTNSAKSADDFDEVSIIRGAKSKGFLWSQDIVENIGELEESRVLTMEDVDELSERFPMQDEEKPITPEQSIQNVVDILGDEDMHSFESVMRNGKDAVKIQTDLSVYSEDIDVTLIYTVGGKIKKIPFTLSITGEKESLQLDLLTDEPFRNETVDSLRNIVLQSLHSVGEKRRQKERTKEQRGEPSPVGDEVVPQPLRITQMSREQRMQHYAEQGTRRRSDSKVERSGVVFGDDAEASSSQEPKRKIIKIGGLRTGKVQEMLDDGKIKVVNAERVVEKIKYLLKKANEAGVAFGTKLSSEPLVGDVDLHQISWKLDNGHTTLRIYFEDMGSSNYRLAGIINMKDASRTRSYVDNLVRQIKEERR